MSSGDIIVTAIILALIACALFSIWHSKRRGKNSCGCNCPGCSKASACNSPNVVIEDEETCDHCQKP